MKKINSLVILSLWLVLTAFAWFRPSDAFSDTERRPLAQLPQISLESVGSGRFMESFEDYTLDQFPLRNAFRTVKSLFHTYVLGQKDNNGIYLHGGYAAQQDHPLNEDSLEHAAERFAYLYEQHLTDSEVFMAIVPDKGYYLAEESGNLSPDYDTLYAYFETKLPWAQQIDLRDTLELSDYYRTDTHWKQENLPDTAEKLCQALGAEPMNREELTARAIERPFYGVYYGQAALPMEPDTLYVLENAILENCTVYDHESGKTVKIYDEEKLTAKDLYEIYLSGSRSLLTVHNPSGEPGRELLVFRDSFGSSILPLLLKSYETVTVIDIRYLQIDLLDRFVDFHGQDTLFLYSTLVLNNSQTIK